MRTSSMITFLGKSLPLMLSIIATAISLATFYLVTLDPGKLQVFISDRVGISVAPETGALSLLVPFVLTNTGSSRTAHHVLSAKIIFQALDPTKKNIELIWFEEYQLINKYQYEAKYGKEKRNADKDQDSPFEQIDYINRALPFALWGGQSLSKVMAFDEMRLPFKSKVGERLSTFRVTLVLTTEYEISKTSATFRCQHNDDILLPEYISCKDVSVWY